MKLSLLSSHRGSSRAPHAPASIGLSEKDSVSTFACPTMSRTSTINGPSVQVGSLNVLRRVSGVVGPAGKNRGLVGPTIGIWGLIRKQNMRQLGPCTAAAPNPTQYDASMDGFT